MGYLQDSSCRQDAEREPCVETPLRCFEVKNMQDRYDAVLKD